ncbi:MAG: hypothetical protein AAGI45_05910 [Cyanobacteria bacterium P01_H01_bin.26]
MTDPITAASIATLIFTTVVGKLTEDLTEETRNQLMQKLQSLKQLMDSKFRGRARAALSRAPQGDDIDRDTVRQSLRAVMDTDDAFAQQVKALAREIEQLKSHRQLPGQAVQSASGHDVKQVSHVQGTAITGDSITVNY